MPLTFFSVFLLKKYLELSPSRIGWKLVILRVVLVAGGGGGSDAQGQMLFKISRFVF